LEANQGERGFGADHYNWALYVKGMHLLTALQGRALDVLHGDPIGEIYEKTVGGDLED
jgi:hypothetical protein